MSRACPEHNRRVWRGLMVVIVGVMPFALSSCGGGESTLPAVNTGTGLRSAVLSDGSVESAAVDGAVEKTVDMDAKFRRRRRPRRQTGSLTVNSTPRNARVFLDGVDTGEFTPVTFRNITPGQHAVRLTLSGFRDGVATVIVTTVRRARVRLTLQSTLGNRPPTINSVTVAPRVLDFLGGVAHVQVRAVDADNDPLTVTATLVRPPQNTLVASLPFTSEGNGVYSARFGAPLNRTSGDMSDILTLTVFVSDGVNLPVAVPAGDVFVLAPFAPPSLPPLPGL